MSSLTRKQKLPYPTPTKLSGGVTVYNERGNGALDLQLLAEAADQRFAVLDTAWPAQLQHPSKILKLTTNLTGLSASTDNFISFDTLVASAGGLTGSSNIDLSGTVAGFDYSGWYHIHYQVSSLPSGTINANTRRQIRADVFSFSEGVLEQYYNEEQDPGGSHVVGNDLSFITFLDQNMIVNLYMFHTNTGSTLNITNTATFASMTRICPAV